MDQEKLESLRDSGAAPELVGYSFDTQVGFVTVNDKVPIPVYSIDSSLPDGVDLEIFNDTNDVIGVLCFCRRLGDVNIGALTEWQFAAYLSEVDVDDFNAPFKFDCDYAVIDLPHLSDYVLNFKSSSVLWGGFSHDPPLMPVKRVVMKLVALRGICYPTVYHHQQAVRAVMSSHTFDRYLKIYHQLELLFDWVVVRRIQNLGDDLTGIAKVMSRHSSGDLPSLKELIKEYCQNLSSVWDIMRTIDSHIVVANDVFQNYGKDGNPLKDQWSNFIAALGSGSYSLANATSNRLANRQDVLDKLVAETAAYWLFRIRCCIAHNRIGEYVLTDNEVQFVLTFGEPLLKVVVAQVLSNPNLPK